MKGYTKKFLCLVLSAVMILSTFITAFASGGSKHKDLYAKVPTVYVSGYGCPIHADKNDINSEDIYLDEVFTEETINNLISGIKEPLLYAIRTDDWQPYSDFLVNTCEKDLSCCKLDVNGDASDGSGVDCRKTRCDVDRKTNGEYGIYSYRFIYDWRLDPFVSAAQLNDYITGVKKATGVDKVNIVGRCLGSNIVLTYLNEYGWNDVNSLSLYIGLVRGTGLVGSIFSGDLKIDPNGLQRFIERRIPDKDNEDIKLLQSILAIMDVVNMLDLPVDLVMRVYEHIYTDVVPRMLKCSYGSFPSFWTFVDDAHYNAAKALMFGGEEQKYEKFIEKIDHFHYQILNRSDEILKKGEEQNIPIYNYVKYGSVIPPICEEAEYCSDGVSTVAGQSFGSVSGTIHRELPYSHIKEVEDRGEGRYISADHLIDASCDRYRDHTWFIKGCDHEVMPEGVDYLMADVIDATGTGKNRQYISIDYFEDYPQFLLASENSWSASISPLTEENVDESEKWHRNILEHINYIFEKFLEFFKEVTDLIMDIIRKIQGEI